MKSLVRVLCVLAGASLSVFAADDASSLIESSKTIALRPAAARRVKGLELVRGAATLAFEEGWLVPAGPADGSPPVEAVFVGSGRLTLAPADEIEQGQLELFTGRPAVSEPFTSALVSLLPPELAVPLGAPAGDPLPEAERDRATKAYGEWRETPVRKRGTARVQLLRGMIDDEVRRQALWIRVDAKNVGVVDVSTTPNQREPFTVEQFVPKNLSEQEKFDLAKLLDHDLASGRLRNFDPDHAGTWNVWLQSPLEGEGRKPREAFEPEHYALDVAFENDGERVKGTARVTLRTVTAAGRTVSFDIHGDLRIIAVGDANGAALPFVQGPSAGFVVLPEAPTGTVTLVFRYEGTLLARGNRKNFSNWSMTGWYPRFGDVNRATYEATFHWPKKFDLMVGARLVERGDEDGAKWAKYVIETPIRGMGFEFGRFDVVQKTQGHLTLTVAFTDQVRTSLSKKTEEDVAERLLEPVQFYEDLFGRFPLDQLTVVLGGRSTNTAIPGLISIGETTGPGLADIFAREWFGALVGAETGHDLWLVRGLAAYARDRFVRVLAKRSRTSFESHSANWRQVLSNWTKGGRPRESVGPLWLGDRLDSTLCECEDDILDFKGPPVVQALARLSGEEKLIATMKDVLRDPTAQPVSANDFLRRLEKRAGMSLAPFEQRFIKGVGLPEVFYTYRIVQTGGSWHVEVKAEQYRDPVGIPAAVRLPDGTFDVEYRPLAMKEVPGAPVVLPIRFWLAPGKEQTAQGKHGPRAYREGDLVMTGPTKTTSADLEVEPDEVTLDAEELTPASTYSETAKPKWALRVKGRLAFLRGDLDQASELLRRALDESVSGRPDPTATPDDLKRVEKNAAWQNAMAQLALIKIELRRGRVAEAREWLEKAKKTFPGTPENSDHELFMYSEARVLIREGKLDAANKLLWTHVLDGETHAGDMWIETAIVAKAKGNARDFDRAIAKCKEIGVDVSELTK